MKKSVSWDDLNAEPLSELEVKWKQFSKEFEMQELRSLLKLEHLRMKKMFGGLAIYDDPQMLFILCNDPLSNSWKGKTFSYSLWDGLLVATSREHHPALQKKMKSLLPHPILGKWLYLSRSSSSWAKDCRQLCKLALQKSELVGVVSKKKKKKKPKASSKKIPNIGKVCKAELEQIGIQTYSDLKKRGWKKTWKQLCHKFPNRKNLNMGRALFGAIHEKPWNKLSKANLKLLQDFQNEVLKK